MGKRKYGWGLIKSKLKETSETDIYVSILVRNFDKMCAEKLLNDTTISVPERAAMLTEGFSSLFRSDFRASGTYRKHILSRQYTMPLYI